MSNEIRVRQNFIGGLVDTADLASGGTTLNSAALAAITSTIDTTNHMPITLDPDGLYGAPEIAYITAYTIGATSATILRGQEGTTARQHLLDTPWVHSPMASDYAYRVKTTDTTTGSPTAASGATTVVASSTPTVFVPVAYGMVQVTATALATATGTQGAVIVPQLDIVDGSNNVYGSPSIGIANPDSQAGNQTAGSPLSSTAITGYGLWMVSPAFRYKLSYKLVAGTGGTTVTFTSLAATLEFRYMGSTI